MIANTAYSGYTKVTGKGGHENQRNNLVLAVGAALAAITAPGGLFAAISESCGFSEINSATGLPVG